MDHFLSTLMTLWRILHPSETVQMKTFTCSGAQECPCAHGGTLCRLPKERKLIPQSVACLKRVTQGRLAGQMGGADVLLPEIWTRSQYTHISLFRLLSLSGLQTLHIPPPMFYYHNCNPAKLDAGVPQKGSASGLGL